MLSVECNITLHVQCDPVAHEVTLCEYRLASSLSSEIYESVQFVVKKVLVISLIV